jgi:hypothetical protein
LEELVSASRGELPREAFRHALEAFEDPERRTAAEALLRSRLTHPAPRAAMREQVMAPTQGTGLRPRSLDLMPRCAPPRSTRA